MTLLFMDSFDHYATGDLLEKWTSQGGANNAISAGNGRNGTSSLRFTIGNHSLTIVLGGTAATWIVGAAFKKNTFTDAMTIFRFDDSGAEQCNVFIDTSGILHARRGSTVLGSSAAPITSNVWSYIECKTTINNTTGSMEVRVNGVTVISVSGVDTQQTGNAQITTLTLGVGSGTTSTEDFDDLVVMDNAGSVNNDFSGDVRIQSLFPNGNGATSDWDGSDGNSTDNYLLVDEAAPNDDTDYISSLTAGDVDTFTYGDLTPTAGTIHAVQILIAARKDDAGTRTIAPVVRPVSTDHVGASVNVSDTYHLPVRQVYEENPETTNPWTLAEVNATQFGVKLIA